MANRILILKPSSLGDVVQAIPVLRMLKRHWPGAEIYWWIEKRSAPLLAGDPDLAGIVSWDRQRWGTPWHYNDIRRCVQELRRLRFDLVIDLQALARSGAIAWLANGSFTIGLEDWRELAPGYYDRSVPRPSPDTHAVDWYLGVLEALAVPLRWDFEWLPVSEAAAAEVTERWGQAVEDAIVLQPGARWENKRWPVDFFARLVRLIRNDRPQQRFIVLGGDSDRDLGARITAAAPEACTDLTGRTTLWQSVELLRSCRVMVTNDTGPMHIAAALKKPVVALFGPTDRTRTGPYGQEHRVLQRQDLPCIPCLSDRCSWPEPIACLRGLSPERVAAAVGRTLETAA